MNRDEDVRASTAGEIDAFAQRDVPVILAGEIGTHAGFRVDALRQRTCDGQRHILFARALCADGTWFTTMSRVHRHDDVATRVIGSVDGAYCCGWRRCLGNSDGRGSRCSTGCGRLLWHRTDVDDQLRSIHAHCGLELAGQFHDQPERLAWLRTAAHSAHRPCALRQACSRASFVAERSMTMRSGLSAAFSTVKTLRVGIEERSSTRRALSAAGALSSILRKVLAARVVDAIRDSASNVPTQPSTPGFHGHNVGSGELKLNKNMEIGSFHEPGSGLRPAN